MRIFDYLKQGQGLTSKAAKSALKQDLVQVDGQLVTYPSFIVDPGWQEISLAGIDITDRQLAHHHYILNKPAGYLSASRDEKWPVALDLITNSHQLKLSLVGRLDKDTRGLLLATNNGQLHYLLEQARFHVEKTYLVKVNGPLNEADCQAFSQGIIFTSGFVCQPAVLEIVTTTRQVSQAYVTITEGQRHQVKKMFLARGLRVIDLQRLRMGPLDLGAVPLAEGSFRPLLADEVNQLKLLMNDPLRRRNYESDTNKRAD
ncbi:hypothetical protein AWM75_04895 [Aerococcus urinaehominis]|uniref:Uncharacterized protein n=1 Tax=Aerococcus urinaehominis TaxID=128944 RepID=A0A109RGX3_9LACT|nr:pseudouridine synthase [Aerococcus urinaehominis]AMB99369.1 hypothetical protein AWM75_04895 [Aerococcus urinaehominis]SDM22646.1 16S rRNA pseudouridine516 synthase [Aerococcus urinaehominis]